MKEQINLKGDVVVVLRDENGKIKEKREFTNLVVTAGKSWIASRMASGASTVMGYIAVGTSGTAAAVGDTALGGELARVSVTVSGGTASTNTVVFAASLPAGTGTGTLQEAGIFNAAAAGTMLARTVYSAINKGAGDTMDISWTITIG